MKIKIKNKNKNTIFEPYVDLLQRKLW